MEPQESGRPGGGSLPGLQVKHRVWVSLQSSDAGTSTQTRRSRRNDTSTFIVGMGVARLLAAIDRTGSLSKAAGELGYSYKYAWDRTQKIKERLGIPAVEAHKGGRGGGGEMRLTAAGRELLATYTDWSQFLDACIRKRDFVQACFDDEANVKKSIERQEASKASKP